MAEIQKTKCPSVIFLNNLHMLFLEGKSYQLQFLEQYALKTCWMSSLIEAPKVNNNHIACLRPLSLCGIKEISGNPEES